MTEAKGSDVRLHDGGAVCAHLRVEYRTEPVEEPKGAVRGFWQCTMCSTKFWPVAGIQLEESRVQAAAAEMQKRCEEKCQEILESRDEDDARGIAAANLCAMEIETIPLPTDALDAMLLRARIEGRIAENIETRDAIHALHPKEDKDPCPCFACKRISELERQLAALTQPAPERK